MKRIAAILLILSLFTGCALSEELSQTFKNKHYTLRLPEDWTISTDNLDEDEDYWELGYLYCEGETILCIAATLEYYEDWTDVSLWKSDQEEMDMYIRDLTRQLSDYEARYLETIYVGKIPFIVMELKNSEREYYAETMTNGYAVGLDFYAMKYPTYKDVEVSHEQYELFVRILNTFEPIV